MTKKEKLLASAQKSLQKGQIAKAIKDYQNLVELDPADLRNRQKLAELYNRSKMPQLAIEEFQKVGKHYTDNGFYLKAIAVFKQIQRIDPNRPDVYLKLAELNEKQGLIGNALAEYRSLVAHHEKGNDAAGAIKILQKMKDIDPENLNIRVKLAETFAKNGMQEEALEDFQDVLRVLQAKKDALKIFKLYEIFAGFFPEELSLKIGLAQALIHKGDVDKGIALLEPLLEVNPSHEEILRTLAEGYRKNGQYAREEELYSQLLTLYPGDLDLRELQIQAMLDGEDFDRALKELEESKAAFFEANRIPKLREYYESLRDRLPGEDRIIATLHSIYEISGDGGKLFDILAVAPTDAEGSEVVDQTPVATLAAADELDLGENPFDTLGKPVPAESEAETEEPEEMPLEFLLEVEEEQSLTDKDEAPPVEGELSLELEIEDAFDDLDFDEPPVAGESAPGESGALELDDGELSLSFEDDEETESFADSEPGETVDVTARIEEAGFYLTQGLVEEAARVCTELLATIPDCPEAEDLLAEIRSRREPSVEDQATIEDDFFNLSDEVMAEVDKVLEEPAPAAVKKSRHPMEGDFSQFKKGIQEQIGSDDAETHFNLGIAYREMGLIDDALGEFNQAMKDPARRVDCLTLKGICLLDQKKFQDAEASFKLGLSTLALAESQKSSLFYELGLLYEAWDRPLEALESFQSAADVDLFFRNVQEKIHELRNRLGMEEEDGCDSKKGSGGKDRVSYV